MDAGESVENPQQPRRKWPAQWGKTMGKIRKD